MNWTIVVNSLIYAVLGVIIFCLAFLFVDRLTPYNLWKELVEKWDPLESTCRHASLSIL